MDKGFGRAPNPETTDARRQVGLPRCSSWAPLDCSVLTSEERLQSPWTVVLASILQAGSKQAPQEMVTALALALRTLGRKSEDTDGIETEESYGSCAVVVGWTGGASLPLAQAGGAMAKGAGRVQALCSGFSNLCVASSSVGVSGAAAPEPQL